MEQTVVYIMLANADARYVFPMPKANFLKTWENQIMGIGYFTGDDEKGDTIIINPNQCGVIKIGLNDGSM